MPHLVVSISGHGFGHVAQTAPILNRLHERIPDLDITVRSAVPLAHLRSRIHAPFVHLTSEGDIGMLMTSALDVCIEESRQAYQRFHADWQARVIGEARLLEALDADMVLSNVGYLPLAGAQLAGIPNIALCSLNWADIYRHYCGEDTISEQIHQCYASADAFLRTTPGMEMRDLHNLIPVAPIAAIGCDRRDVLRAHLRLSDQEKLVLVSMGGIASRLPIEGWPRIDGVRWLVQQAWQVEHPDAIEIESIPLSFSDLLASCDALLCKPGYGSFVEASCCATPILYVDRSGWPETRALTEWLQRHSVCREIARCELEQGTLVEALEQLWEAHSRESMDPQGGEQVTEWLAARLLS